MSQTKDTKGVTKAGQLFGKQYRKTRYGSCWRGCERPLAPKATAIHSQELHYAVCTGCGTWIMSDRERQKMTLANVAYDRSIGLASKEPAFRKEED